MRLIIFVFTLFNSFVAYTQCNENSPVNWEISQTSPNEIYRLNLNGMGVKGGDTVRITGTNYTVIEFFNQRGDECRPIVIMPKTKLSTGAFRINGDCRYLKILGGDSLYGIKINGAFSVTKAKNIYASNIECYGGSIGIYARLDPDSGDSQTWYPNYIINKLTFDRFYIHDVSGEGMYIGNTSNGYTIKSPTSKLDTFVTAVRLDSVSITNCTVVRCGWDGIQAANIRNGGLISGNTVMDVGLQNESAQKAGILLGTNGSADILNNVIRRAAGNGIQNFGYGNMKIAGNIVDSCGFSDEVVNGEQSIYGADYQYAYEGSSLPDQSIEFYNNYIRKPQARGAISFYEINGRSGTMNVHDNTFCIPNAQPNWQSTYFTFPNTFGNNNNVLYCEQPCNCIITNILKSGKYIN